MPEEVPRGADAEPLELLGPPLADALEKLDRGIEAKGAAGSGETRGIPCVERLDRDVFEPSRCVGEPLGVERLEVVDALRPRRGTGWEAPSSRRSAATAPPRALPSSLVTTMPVGLTACANSLPCCTAFCPTVPSSTSKRLVRRARQPAAADADHLAQLVHQAFLGVQPAGRVDDDGVEPAGDRGVDGVERHRGRIASGLAGHAREAEPVGPDLQLGDGAGAVGVGRGEQHLAALPLEPAGELGGGGGLPGAVDPDHEDDGGPRLGARDGARDRSGR